LATHGAEPDLQKKYPPGVQEKKMGHVLTESFPQDNPQAATACLWKKGAGSPLAEVFPRYGTHG
jgi:hypothetical protein